jgi:hypothetical protein
VVTPSGLPAEAESQNDEPPTIHLPQYRPASHLRGHEPLALAAATVFAEGRTAADLQEMKISVDSICNLLTWWQSKVHLLVEFE